MTQEQLPLDHTHTSPAPPPHPLLLVVAGILSFLLWLPVVGQLVFIVPRFEGVSANFKMKLPLMTEWVIRSSRWGIPAIIITTLLVCIGLGRRSLWPWVFLLFVLPLVFNVILGVSIVVPYMGFLEGLGGGGAKK